MEVKDDFLKQVINSIERIEEFNFPDFRLKDLLEETRKISRIIDVNLGSVEANLVNEYGNEISDILSYNPRNENYKIFSIIKHNILEKLISIKGRSLALMLK